MSESTWYRMGMREGVFRGTTPAVFMNELYKFFLNLRDQCRRDVYSTYVTPESEKNFNFTGRDKFGRWQGLGYDFYRSKFTYQPVPLGSPIPEELWTTENPEWKKTSFSEKELLNEEIVPHELTISYNGGPYKSMSMQWEKQRYRVVQKMRYCIIPLKILTRDTWWDPSGERWYEWYGNTGCVDQGSFSWESYRQLKVSVPDFWTKEGTQYKIGVFAENNEPYTQAPVSGCRWFTQKELTTSQAPAGSKWRGSSTLRIYGAVDLSTHPDYSKYFDIEPVEEKGEN